MVWKLLAVRTDINVSGKKLLHCSANATWLGAGRAPCTPKIRKKEEEVFVSHQLSAPTCDLAFGKKGQEASVHMVSCPPTSHLCVDTSAGALDVLCTLSLLSHHTRSSLQQCPCTEVAHHSICTQQQQQLSTS